MSKAKIILYKQKTLSDGTHPVVIQVIHQRKAKRISLGMSCFPYQWHPSSSQFNENFPGYSKANKRLDIYKAKMHQSLDRFELEEIPFTIDRFRSNLGSTGKTKSVLETFKELINRYDEEGRIGNRMVYKDTSNALKRYVGTKNPTFQDVDYRFLVGFETFMRKGGNSDSTIRVRMRTLRAVYNEAIRLGYVSIEFYPFARLKGDTTKYSLNRLTIARNIRGLQNEEMDKIKSFDTRAYPSLEQSWLLFIFSYYVNGMNFTDMAYLTWDDCKGERIRYTRRKTGRLMNVKITEPIADILDHFRKRSDSKYVFPILKEDIHVSPDSQKNRIRKFLKKMNNDLKDIGVLLGIELKLTSYVSRHSFAQRLQSKNAPVEGIQSLLGHSDDKTTQIYLRDLDGSKYDHLSDLL